MGETEKTVLEMARMGSDGEVILPTSYRDAEHLVPGAMVAMVQVGDTLVLAPVDDRFSSVTGRLEAAMLSAGANIDEIIAAAASARTEIVQEEFGRKDDN